MGATPKSKVLKMVGVRGAPYGLRLLFVLWWSPAKGYGGVGCCERMRSKP